MFIRFLPDVWSASGAKIGVQPSFSLALLLITLLLQFRIKSSAWVTQPLFVAVVWQYQFGKMPLVQGRGAAASRGMREWRVPWAWGPERPPEPTVDEA